LWYGDSMLNAFPYIAKVRKSIKKKNLKLAGKVESENLRNMKMRITNKLKLFATNSFIFMLFSGLMFKPWSSAK